MSARLINIALCVVSSVLYFLTFLNFGWYPLIWTPVTNACLHAGCWIESTELRNADVKRALREWNRQIVRERLGSVQTDDRRALRIVHQASEARLRCEEV